MNLRSFAARNAVPLVAVVAAFATCVAVPPDGVYLGYIDLNTLGRLACVLAVVSALRRSGAFQALACALAGRCRSARSLVAALVGCTGLASMFVTNDMALLALLPLAAAALLAVGRRDLIARTFVLQGIAANLCGMLLPFGNPQNIFLVERYDIGLGAFLGVMVPPFALSAVLVALGCFVSADAGRVAVSQPAPRVDALRTGVLAALLAVCVACVLGVVPVGACLVAVAAVLLAVDRRVFLQTDWGLMVTFAAFFVFSGNLARIDAVSSLFAGLLAGGAFVPAALLSQLISNVPAAVVLARFTTDWPGLLAGVNVGGAGTPVASLATLIVITQFRAIAPSAGLNGRRFAALLLALNAACLAVLLAVGAIAGW